MYKVIKFYSPKCQPCKQIEHRLQELCWDIYKIELEEIDGTQNLDLVAEHLIRSVPTLILLKDGVETTRHVGAVGFEEWLDENII